MVASFATRTVANFRLPRLIDDSKRARPRIRGTRRLPVRNLLVHFPARGRRYPSSREGPREVSAREVRASGRRQDAHASSSRSLVPPTHAHAREIDRPRREKRGGNITLVTRIYTMNTFELKRRRRRLPSASIRSTASGGVAVVPSCQVRRAKPVRSTFARGDESTPTAICLPPSRKKGSGKPTSASFRAFDAALTRAASLEIPSRHPLRRAKSDIRSRPVDVASPIPRKPSPTPPSPCSVSHAD